jgi:NADH:ubiquinone reductase (H+-translocating)
VSKHYTYCMKHIIIVGAGFGGLRLAQKLINHPHYTVTIIDKVNHHQFQPLFYQVATAGLDPSSISFPLRKVFQDAKNVHVRMADVHAINHTAKNISTSIGDIDYDYLVIATGATTNFFGNEVMAANALPMKSTAEALHIREQLLLNIEQALNSKNEDKTALLNVCIVGGGPTGVELAGAIAEMKKYILPKDYPELDFTQMHIYLFEGSATTLENMSIKSQQQSMQYLKKLGVTLKTSTKVTAYDGNVLSTNTGEQIPCKNVIWAAGIKGNVPAGIDATILARGNRILVDELCQVQGMQHIYAIGDVACCITDESPKGHPQVAPVAIQQADMLAYNFKQLCKSHYSLDTFSYNDKGSMATVGRNLAVVDVPTPKLHFGGFIAWLIWMGLHLFLILGIKNKLFIFLNWLYNYFTYDQSLRLVFKKGKG